MSNRDIGLNSSQREYFNRRIVNEFLRQFFLDFDRQEKERFDLETKKYEQDRKRLDLLLASSSTETIYGILKSNAPLNAQGEPEITAEYQAFMEDMICDSLKAEVGSMSLSSLKTWYGKFPGCMQIAALIAERQAKEETLKEQFGKLPTDLTGAQLDKWEQGKTDEQWQTKAASPNTSKFVEIASLGLSNDVKSIWADSLDILKTLSSDRSAPGELLKKDFGWPYNHFNLSA